MFPILLGGWVIFLFLGLIGAVIIGAVLAFFGEKAAEAVKFVLGVLVFAFIIATAFALGALP